MPWNLKVQGALKSCLASSLGSLCDRHATAKYDLPGHEMLFYSMSDLAWEAGKFGVLDIWFCRYYTSCHTKWHLLQPKLENFLIVNLIVLIKKKKKLHWISQSLQETNVPFQFWLNFFFFCRCAFLKTELPCNCIKQKAAEFSSMFWNCYTNW